MLFLQLSHQYRYVVNPKVILPQTQIIDSEKIDIQTLWFEQLFWNQCLHFHISSLIPYQLHTVNYEIILNQSLRNRPYATRISPLRGGLGARLPSGVVWEWDYPQGWSGSETTLRGGLGARLPSGVVWERDYPQGWSGNKTTFRGGLGMRLPSGVVWEQDSTDFSSVLRLHIPWVFMEVWNLYTRKHSGIQTIMFF